MSNIVQSNAIESALMHGDLSKLTAEQRLSYFNEVCKSLGLNPLTQPLAYLNLSGRLTLYAKKDATDQLRKIHGVSITKLEDKLVGDVYKVTAYAKDKDGKEDADEGAVDVKGLTGEKLANALMKATTKAKRRVTLSICGLGLLDETEVADIPAEVKQQRPVDVAQIDMGQGAGENDEDLGSYVIKFGAHKGTKLKDFGENDLDRYVNSLQKYDQSAKPLVVEFLEVANAYLKSLEFER